MLVLLPNMNKAAFLAEFQKWSHLICFMRAMRFVSVHRLRFGADVSRAEPLAVTLSAPVGFTLRAPTRSRLPKTHLIRKDSLKGPTKRRRNNSLGCVQNNRFALWSNFTCVQEWQKKRPEHHRLWRQEGLSRWIISFFSQLPDEQTGTIRKIIFCPFCSQRWCTLVTRRQNFQFLTSLPVFIWGL